MIKLIGKIITNDKIIDRGEICFSGNKTIYVGEIRENNDITNVIDFGDKYISSGFTDIHVHGGGGFDFSDGSEEAFINIAKFHSTHGTATMLPTTLSCSDEELISLFETFKKVSSIEYNGAYFPGIHIEGPYCAISQKGAQDEKYIKTPSPEHYNKILEYSDIIKRWTIAPELDGAIELGKILSERGIVPSIGHSDALYEDAVIAFENGYKLMTHFYSGMSSMIRKNGFRYPGLIEAGYMIDDMNVEIIADGCHLPISILKYLYKVKGSDKIALCTDGMRAAGQLEGYSILGSLDNGYQVVIEDGVAKLMDRSAFAGSIATTDRLVRTMYKDADISLIDAVKMITCNPCKMANIQNKGYLKEGYDADYTIFDDDINVYCVYSNGKKVYEKCC